MIEPPPHPATSASTAGALSPNQRAMWATQRRHRSSPLLNVPLTVHIHGRVDADRLALAFSSVAADTPLLRSRLVERSGEPGWETSTDSIGAVLHKDVDLDRLPPATPALARHVLRRCLERDRGRRQQGLQRDHEAVPRL